MKLSKVRYKSAIFFGAIALVIYLLFGILQLILTSYYQTDTINSAAMLLILVKIPIIMGIIFYVFSVVTILVYNIIARKFPISWELKK
jgi:tellurite resistance protein TehA-like permease